MAEILNERIGQLKERYSKLANSIQNSPNKQIQIIKENSGSKVISDSKLNDDKKNIPERNYINRRWSMNIAESLYKKLVKHNVAIPSCVESPRNYNNEQSLKKCEVKANSPDYEGKFNQGTFYLTNSI